MTDAERLDWIGRHQAQVSPGYGEFDVYAWHCTAWLGGTGGTLRGCGGTVREAIDSAARGMAAHAKKESPHA